MVPLRGLRLGVTSLNFSPGSDKLCISDFLEMKFLEILSRAPIENQCLLISGTNFTDNDNNPVMPAKGSAVAPLIMASAEQVAVRDD